MEHATIRQLLGLSANAEPAADIEVTGIAYRSDSVLPGDAFFCVRGFKHDGHEFASDAASRGASVLVCEEPVESQTPQVIVADTRAALASAADAFNGHPSRVLKVIGVTGTNGKTTTTYIIDSILRAAGHTTGIIGTVETRVAGEKQPSSRTTPESADLHALLAEMRDRGVSAVSMEVSSHAIQLQRVAGVRFAAAAFTNLTQDHLDFHHTLAEYAGVKRRLFTDYEVGAGIVNVDDPFGMGIAADLPGVVRVGRASDSDVRAVDERLTATGTTFTLVTPIGQAPVRLPLAGAFNVSNALVAAGCAVGLGIPLETVVAGLESAPQVPGRLERIECGQPFSVVVDYAHTPDSLEKAIAAVREVTSGRVITVFGCGGDRDPDKRPVMGLAGACGSDLSIITSDNPRSEDPVGIMLQVEDGAKRSGNPYEVLVDRREAIFRAIHVAEKDDTVLIAGKGHEDYQIFSDRTVHFDDREVAREALERRQEEGM